MLADLAGGHALRSGLHQQAEDGQARLLGQRRQGGQRMLGLHEKFH